MKPTDTVIFLGTGTGEALHNYMLWELLKSQHAGRIVAVCCVRYFRDLGYRDIHERLMTAVSELQLRSAGDAGTVQRRQKGLYSGFDDERPTREIIGHDSTRSRCTSICAAIRR